MKKITTSEPAVQFSQNGQQKQEAIQVEAFQAWFGSHRVLRDIHMHVPKNRITCIIGPSGSGKTTLVRSMNRMNDNVPKFTCEGRILFDQTNIYHNSVDVTRLRTRVGMVFQEPCVFPRSIFDNVLFGISNQKKLSKGEREEVAEKYLKAAALWDGVQDRLQDKADNLSRGQQQRLCIARTLAVAPEVVLLDEPTSSLDPVASRSIEQLMVALKEHYTIVFVTHDIQQAKRIADHLVFICEGQVIESGPSEQLFNAPQKEQTRSYLRDEYCDC